ncbi:MAG TPA: NAD(P)H-dependent oxidoreductase subunit E [Bacteroidales bacterium]|jgi:NADH:ubiquinone oxidoreductase subunit E|nr:NAD(P)H-dependent oxidoreductase subunit E [Bacteroidales bacterium]HOH83267.1 NAD(P)H-dependent oxidoreductase subunit E [Bacteroidales bacterium]HPB24434.1 NAD(P)H-dependent oxidoreductase subunit E [Bacteroidales bacterium]HPI29342.1 NAD(P)H-dependent oxidoreductase subunit E [Bacteroidales bacterium]HQN14962.1 NAD(P)H-dependent oxidoreductase subunit E [Bacteroidales bacterium]
MSENKSLIQEFVRVHGCGRNNLLPLLQEIVHQENFLSEEAVQAVADTLQIPASEVYGTATFYNYLDTEARGKYVIRLCRNISCMMQSQAEIVSAISLFLKIKVGETTSDKKFSLLQANCLGWCHKAPAMMINNEVYTELTPQKAVQIIKEYKEK